MRPAFHDTLGNMGKTVFLKQLRRHTAEMVVDNKSGSDYEPRSYVLSLSMVGEELHRDQRSIFDPRGRSAEGSAAMKGLVKLSMFALGLLNSGCALVSRGGHGVGTNAAVSVSDVRE